MACPDDGDDHHALLRFEYDGRSRARTVERSVRVEVGEIDDDRSSARTSRDGATVEVTVLAADLVALRASLNTWMRLVDVAETAATIGEAGTKCT